MTYPRDAMPSDDDISMLRQLIRRVEDDLHTLAVGDRAQIEEAMQVVRRTRRSVRLGMPTIAPPATHSNWASS
ncbi:MULTISPECIES: hypothetical protein [Parafrankia]|uniref:hypothetical protein n=1 Tax=Parafrankia TaxID=2994362 RepID=UPI0013F4EEF8|nr:MULTISPECIES: hypothetical protein [Parafrankia]MBE3201341.1 hypothetical protein [Parafrankia sp. CH37]